MKKIKLITLMLLTFIMTACVNTKIISSSDYNNIMKKDGYEVSDYTNKLAFSKTSYLAIKNDITSYYVELDSTTLAKDLYKEEITNANKLYTDVVDKMNKDSEEFSFYEVSTNEEYYVISRIKNTYIVFKSNINNKNNVIKTLRKLKYYNK